MMKNGELTKKEIDNLAQRFKILSLESRLTILSVLFTGEKNVTEIIEATGLLQSNVSKQLKALSDEGIIKGVRRGSNKYYKLIDETVMMICSMMCQNKVKK
jgi:ArsR family transcriptional regulator